MTALERPCVIGGWTEPRGSRPFFGSLLLGAYDEEGRLQYLGQAHTGFTHAEIGRVWKRLQALKAKTPPFETPPAGRERPYWVRPVLVADIRSSGQTTAGTLRQPAYVRLREDLKPDAVRIDTPAPRAARPKKGGGLTSRSLSAVLAQIDAIESGAGDGVLALPGDERLEVTNLRKTFWTLPARTPQRRSLGPADRRGRPSGRPDALTKGDLFRHYVRAAPYILPVLAGRPLVMKRYPNGVQGKPFYQHRAPDTLPPGVRVAMVESASEKRPHLVGGDLKTLLYTVQLASISQDPWFSSIDAQDEIDHVALDLDPPDDLPFARVLDVARWVKEELDALEAPGFAKTSGSGGLHVYVPMPPHTPYDAGFLFAQIVATRVATKHPKLATVERSLAARGRRIYVDYMQNARGKTLASAYSARANAFAGVSTPLTWDEVDENIAPQDFTIRNFEERMKAVGDLWAALRKAKPPDLRKTIG